MTWMFALNSIIFLVLSILLVRSKNWWLVGGNMISDTEKVEQEAKYNVKRVKQGKACLSFTWSVLFAILAVTSHLGFSLATNAILAVMLPTLIISVAYMQYGKRFRNHLPKKTAL